MQQEVVRRDGGTVNSKVAVSLIYPGPSHLPAAVANTKKQSRTWMHSGSRGEFEDFTKSATSKLPLVGAESEELYGNYC